MRMAYGSVLYPVYIGRRSDLRSEKGRRGESDEVASGFRWMLQGVGGGEVEIMMRCCVGVEVRLD